VARDWPGLRLVVRNWLVGPTVQTRSKLISRANELIVILRVNLVFLHISVTYGIGGLSLYCGIAAAQGVFVGVEFMKWLLPPERRGIRLIDMFLKRQLMQLL
jgi:hypothetical protein